MVCFCTTKRQVRCTRAFLVTLAVVPLIFAVAAYLAGLDKHALLSVSRASPAPVMDPSGKIPPAVRETARPQPPAASSDPHPLAGISKVPDPLPDIIRPITVSLLSPRKGSIKVGDVIHYRITCRHENGSLTLGGGMWYAFLSSQSNPKASTTGRVVDHKNGSYSIYAYAGWAGTGTLAVTRVLDNDAVDYMNNTIWPAEGRGVWRGIFEAKPGKKSTTAYCWLTRTGNLTGKCLYPNPNAIGKTVFYCDKPEGVECDKLTGTKSDSKAMQRVIVGINRENKNLIARAKSHLRVPITLETPVVNIFGPPNASIPTIHGCQRDAQFSDGYWLENKWYSLICENEDWTEKSKLTSCLRHRQLFIYGDSTSRQWFLHIHKLLDKTFTSLPGELGFFYLRHYEDIDVSLQISFPKQLLGSATVRLRGVFYEHDLIDALNDTRCNYILVLSPWAHFTTWSRDSYTERTLLLREALLRFRRRCPNALMVLKGPHARKGVGPAIFSDDFINRGIGEINHRILGDIGVWHLPLWDLNNAAPHGNGIHMPDFVVHEEIKVLLSFVCGGSKLPPLDN